MQIYHSQLLAEVSVQQGSACFDATHVVLEWALRSQLQAPGWWCLSDGSCCGTLLEAITQEIVTSRRS